jgi:hypothetical protein
MQSTTGPFNDFRLGDVEDLSDLGGAASRFKFIVAFIRAQRLADIAAVEAPVGHPHLSLSGARISDRQSAGDDLLSVFT